MAGEITDADSKRLAALFSRWSSEATVSKYELDIAVAVAFNAHNDYITQEERVEHLNEVCKAANYEPPTSARIDESDFQKLLQAIAVSKPPLAEILARMEEALDIIELFRIFASVTPDADTSGLATADMNLWISLYNKINDEVSNDTKASKPVLNYYDRLDYGSEIRVDSYTRWLVDETVAMDEDFSVDSSDILKQLRQFALCVKLFRTWDWRNGGHIQVSDLQETLKSFNEARGEAVGLLELYEPPSAEAIAAMEPAGARKSQPSKQDEVISVVYDPTVVKVKEFSLYFRNAILKLEDGEDTFENIVCSLVDILKPRDIKSAVVDVFKRYDSTGEGTIDREDLKIVMNKIESFQPEELEFLMNGADTYKTGKIKYAEFATWMMLPKVSS